jgi:hypothetical protein
MGRTAPLVPRAGGAALRVVPGVQVRSGAHEEAARRELMDRNLCIVLVALTLTIAALVFGCVFGDYWRDTEMARLGYEQAMDPGYSWPVWKRAEAK